MRDELDEFLVKRYPKIFRNRNEDASETAMCWGFECGDGWFNIINTLCASVDSHIKYIEDNNKRNQKYLDDIAANKEVPAWVHKSHEEGRLTIEPVPEFVATQVKEKFGTLRFYHDGGDEAIQGMVSVAQSMSGVTCEECGSPGKLRRGSWIRVLCDNHAKKEEEKEPLKVGDKVYGLIPGQYIKLEIERLISQEEFIGVRLFDFGEEKSATKEYFSAKYMNNDVHPYWSAEKFDG